LIKIQQKNLAQQKKVLQLAFESWKNKHEQIDDVLVFAIKI
jgi:hypothetical protein